MMVISQRERYIVIGTIAAVALFILNYAIYVPFTTAYDKVSADLADARREKAETDLLFARQKLLQKVWADMQKGGLKVDPSQAESQTLHAVLDWAAAADLNLSALKPERSTQEKKFQVIGFGITGNGSTPAIARLLWAMETASTPVRVNDMKIRPLREGTDNLQVNFTISALCLPPDTNTSSNAGASASAGGQP